MSNLITIPFKATRRIDLPTAILAQIIELGSVESEFKLDSQALAKQRNDLFEGGNSLEVHPAILNKLITYYAQLSFILTKFPHDIKLEFPWYSIFSSPNSSLLSLGAFKSATPISLSDLGFERISILFNIGIMYLSLGVKESRTTAEEIKSSTAAFQNAAGTFDHLISLLSSIRQPDVPNPVSPDLSLAAITTLRNLSLAQAQEVAWQKAGSDRLKNGTIAKLANKVSEFYAAANDSAAEAKGGAGLWPLFSFPPEFLNHLNYKTNHFAAAAQYRKSADDLASNRYGNEIARLELASSFVKKALDGPKKGVAPAVVDDIKGLQLIIAENLVRSKKDNSLIYLEKVPNPTELPPIVSTSVVKATFPKYIATPIVCLHSGEDGFGEPLFSKLMSWETTCAISIYDDRKEDLVRNEIVGRKDELDSLATSTLQSLNLPAAIQAISQPIGLPSSLIAKSEEVIALGGSKRVKLMMNDVRKLSNTGKRLLDEISSILEEEAQEDDALRSQYGTNQWTRLPSTQANQHLINSINTYQMNLSQATTADNLVRAKFGEWEEWIEILESDQQTIESAIPSLPIPQMRFNPTQPPTAQSTALRTLSRLLDDLQDLQAARKMIVDNAKRTLAGDDLRSKIIRKAAELVEAGNGTGAALFEEFFDEELGKYRKFKQSLNVSESKQEDLLEKIRTANSSFLQVRKSDPILKARETALQNFDSTFSNFQEISHQLLQGIQFHSSFSTVVNNLLNQSKHFANERKMEVNALLSQLRSNDSYRANDSNLAQSIGRVELNSSFIPPKRAGIFDPKNPMRFAN